MSQETEEKNYFWIPKIQEALFKQDESPLISGCYPLDLNRLVSHLSTFFELENLQITLGEIKWRDKEEIKKGFSSSLVLTSIATSPLPGEVLLLLDREGMRKWLSFFQGKQLADEHLEKGFFTFLLLEALSFLEKEGFFPDLSPLITKETHIPDRGLTIDIKIGKKQSSFPLRLILPDLFRQAWNQYFLTRYPKEFSKSLSLETILPLEFRIGTTSLSHDQLHLLKKGSFLLLDQIYYDLDTEKGHAVVMVHEVPIFRAKLKQNRVKLLDYALYQEVNQMTTDEFSEEAGEALAPHAEEQPVSLKNLPLTVVVELARCSISLGKLKELEPGNYLDLPVSPEQGVTLTIQGKSIAKGELVYLGETLGVRITEVGK